MQTVTALTLTILLTARNTLSATDVGGASGGASGGGGGGLYNASSSTADVSAAGLSAGDTRLFFNCGNHTSRGRAEMSETVRSSCGDSEYCCCARGELSRRVGERCIFSENGYNPKEV